MKWWALLCRVMVDLWRMSVATTLQLLAKEKVKRQCLVGFMWKATRMLKLNNFGPLTHFQCPDHTQIYWETPRWFRPTIEPRRDWFWPWPWATMARTTTTRLSLFKRGRGGGGSNPSTERIGIVRERTVVCVHHSNTIINNTVWWKNWWRFYYYKTMVFFIFWNLKMYFGKGGVPGQVWLLFFFSFLLLKCCGSSEGSLNVV